MFLSRKPRFKTLTIALIFFFAAGSHIFAQKKADEATPPNFKIAFIGDQGYGDSARAVLKLIKSEKTHVVVHAGDFDYKHNPQGWNAQINGVLGKNFPYFSAAGNHDVKRWFGSDGYQELIEDRFERQNIPWDGDMGVNSSFHYKGILFIMSSPDVIGEGHAKYIHNILESDKALWRIACWHKNQQTMQVGGKKDETGWEVYEEARKGGAIIATGHEHSYSRTYLLSDMENHTIASKSDTLNITQGETFAFVSGIAGQSIRVQKLEGDWWAKMYTATQNATYGALFGIFNRNGNPRLAEFYFKDIDGKIADHFWVINNIKPGFLPIPKNPAPEK